MKIKKTRRIPILLTIFLFLLLETRAKACSMYKLTVDGKTMVGCNEDAWRITSSIWFKNAKGAEKYGAAFTGSRQVSSNRTAPQSGMNERGLVFSRLTAYYPKQNNPFPNRVKIRDEVDYLTGILHQCATVDEVKKFIEQYDHSVFYNDVFIYIDSLGNYLIVEPSNLLKGNKPYYVLSNFCPTITDNQNARTLERYRNGEDFLKKHQLSSSLAFCSALSDTMHVCRNRNGDGTLLTSIWDTREGLVNLYFYHTYDSTVQFSLTEVLSKGDHSINIPDIFPENKAFERLKNYLTPFNKPELRVSLVVLGAFLSLFSVLLGISKLWKQNFGISSKAVVLISTMNILLTAYLFILATNIYIYYFDAPYKHHSSNLISATSFIPFLLVAVIVPFTLFTINKIKSPTPSWMKVILGSNYLIYFWLFGIFDYWGLYSFWN